MSLEHAGIVHGVDVVAGEDQHVIRIGELDESNVLIDSISRAAIPFGILLASVRRQNEAAAAVAIEIPCTAGAEVVMQFERLVLGEHADFFDAGVGAV